MKHLDKSKKELIDELEKMHQKYNSIVALHQQESLERKQTEKALRSSETKFRALFEQSGGYCMVLDPNTEDGIPIIVDANIAACKMHGYSREEFIGRPVADIDNEDGKKLVKERTALIMTGKPFYVENIHKRKDGTFFTVAVNAKRIDIEGEPPLIFTVEYDITERVKAEEALRHSEATIRNKLKAITEPEGDIGSLELSDIIDMEMLRSMMEDFYQLTGMLAAVLDVSGNVLIAVGWQDICTKFHRCHPDSLKNCIESDTILASGVPEGTFKSYHCKNNMWDIVTPITVGGKHVGNVFMGQYFLEGELPDYEFFRKQAQKYGFDEEAYLAALDRVPRFSQETVDAGMQFYSKLAGFISTLSYSSIQQSRMLAESKQIESDLIKAKNKAEENQKLYEDLVQSSHNLIWKCDIEGKFTFLNSAWEKTHGYRVEEMLGRPFSDFQRPEVFERDVIEFTKHLKGGFVKGYETTHIIKDGTEIPLIFNALPLSNSLGEIIGTQGTAFDISKLKQTESDLTKAKDKAEESEKKYRELIHLAQEGIWVIDKNNITSFANPSMAKMLGYPPEEMMGKSLFDFMDETGIKIANENLERRKAGVKEQHDFEFICKDGDRIYCTMAAAPIIDSTGNYQGSIAGVIDITERKNEEKILNTESKLFEYAINHSEEEFLQKFLDETEALTGSDIGFYHYIEDDQESISLQTWSTNTINNMCKGLGEKTRHYPVSEAGVWVDCVKERKPVIHNDYLSLTHKKGLPEGHAPITRELVVPVIRGNQIKAVLGVGNKKTDYNDTDVKNVQRLADVAWETVVRKQAEEKIRIAEKNLKNTFDLSPSIICKANLNTGYFIEANQAVTRILGYSVEEFTSTPFIDLIHPDDQQKSSDEKNEQIKGKEVTSFENRYLCKDGTYKWIAWHGTRADEHGIVTAIGSDISLRKSHEVKLRESEEKYRSLIDDVLDTSSVGIFILDAEFKVAWINRATEKYFGIKRENVIGKDKKQLIDSKIKWIFEDPKYFTKKVFNTYQHNNYIENFECHIIPDKDREERWLSHWSQPITEGIYRNGRIEQYTDITDRIKAEENKRTAEESLKNTFDLSPSIICKGNINTGYFIEASQAVTRILGYSVEEFTSKPFIEFVHPDDKQNTIDEMSELQAGKEMAFFDNRYLCKDGSYKWMTWHGSKADKYGMVTAIASDITDRKQNEENIKKSQSLLQQAEEISNQGAWEWDIGKDEWTFSENWLRIHGCQLTGIKREELMKIAYSEDAPRVEIAFQDALKGIARYDLEHRIVRKNDGKVRNVKAVGDFIFNDSGTRVKMYGVTQDITEKKQAESEVRRLSTAVKQSPSVIVITDAKGKLEYVNPKFTELTGYSRAESIGKESNILKSGEQDAAFYKEMWETVESGKVWRGQFHNKKKNGELFWEAASISAILNESGDVINFIKIGEDITQQKNTEEELKAALGKAQESDRLKSAFLANMSHEIRTPMNGILGFASLLKEPDLTGEKQQEYIGIIQRGGARMLNIINDIISISMIESGQMKLNIQESNIHHQIEYIYNFFKLEVKEKGIQFSFNSPLLLRETSIKTDREKVFAILTNLVKNAIKYTDSGSIDFGFHKKGDFLEFYVKDTGIGIPKDRQKAIFERFIQADIEDAMAKQGAGLGLAISKAYVENLGGKIWVESEEDKSGSTFYFTLPYQTETTSETITDNSIMDPEEVNAISKLNILIVEDDEISEELITIIVEEFGKEITVARTGKEAVEACRQNPDMDLILMDIQLPEMNGYMATSHIRKFNKEVIIIAQTAYALEGDKEKAIAAGCDDYIQKPMNKEALVHMINTYFGPPNPQDRSA